MLDIMTMNNMPACYSMIHNILSINHIEDSSFSIQELSAFDTPVIPFSGFWPDPPGQYPGSAD